MGDIKSIDGAKRPKGDMCPYCGLVPTTDHPEFTCPRLAGAGWGDGGTSVEFIDPDKWEAVKARLK